MAENDKRFIWADIIRILAIYLVILIHALSVSSKASFPFSLAIASISVPLFVILSGALLLNKQENYKNFYKKRMLRILIPWIFWTMIYLFINFTQNHFAVSTFVSHFSSTLTSFWFLPMIACIYILTPALRIFIKNAAPKDISFVILIWFMSISLLPFFRNSAAFPISVDDGLVRQFINYSGYFLLGGLITKLNYENIKLAIISLFTGFILIFSCFYIQSFNNNIIAFNPFSFIFPGIIISASSIFLLIKSFNKKLNLLSKPLKMLIISLSSASFGIYFLHQLVFDVILNFTNKYSWLNLGFSPEWIISILIFIISYAVIVMLTKIPRLKNFIT